MNRFSLTLAFAAALLGSGCAHEFRRDHVADGWHAGKAGVVAVLPFQNLTTSAHAGEVVSRLVATEMYARGFTVVTPTEVRRRLKVSADDEGSTLAAADLREVGKTLGADTVLFGSVGELRYKRDLGEDPIVGFTVELIDVATGKVVWTASHSRSEFGIVHNQHNVHQNVQQVASLMFEQLEQQAGRPGPVQARAQPAEAAPVKASASEKVTSAK